MIILGVDASSSLEMPPDVCLFKASYAGSQLDYQRIMPSFNWIILHRKTLYGGRVTDGPSVKTFLLSQSACNGRGGGGGGQTCGLLAWWQSCCWKTVYRQKADGQATKSPSMCLPSLDRKLKPDCSSGWSLVCLEIVSWKLEISRLDFVLQKAQGFLKIHNMCCLYLWPTQQGCDDVRDDMLNYCCWSWVMHLKNSIPVHVERHYVNEHHWLCDGWRVALKLHLYDSLRMDSHLRQEWFRQCQECWR